MYKKIMAGLEEFQQALKNDTPLKTTRVERHKCGTITYNTKNVKPSSLFKNKDKK